MVRETITLQLGNYANYVGAHFWNYQDEQSGLAEADDKSAPSFAELNISSLYRENSSKQATSRYTPRLVFLDTNGALGGVTFGDSDAAAVVNDAAVRTWGGGTRVVRRDPVPKSDFVRALEAEEARLGTNQRPPARPPAHCRSFHSFCRGLLAGVARSRSAQAGEAGEGEEPGYADEDQHWKRAFQGGAAGGSGAAAAAAAAAEEAAAAALAAAAASLDSKVDYWTDFLKAPLSRRSCVLVRGAWHGVTPFAGFGDGRALAPQDALEDAVDGMRHLAEECDSIETLQCLLDDQSGFGGLAPRLLTELRDDFPRVPLLLFCCRRPTPPEFDPDRSAPWAASRISLGLSASLLAPVVDFCTVLESPATLPHLAVDAAQDYHTSAVCATALEVVTSCWRAGGERPAAEAGSLMGPQRVHSWLYGLTMGNSERKFASTGIAFPAPGLVRSEVSRTGAPGQLSVPLDEISNMAFGSLGLGDGAGRGRGLLFESFIARGIRTVAGEPAGASPAAVQDAIARTAARTGPSCPRHACALRAPLALPLPFPRLMPRTTAAPGLPPDNPHNLPALVRLSASADLGKYLDTLAKDLKRYSGEAAGKALVTAWEFDREDIVESVEALRCLGRAYLVDDDGDDLLLGDDDEDSDGSAG